MNRLPKIRHRARRKRWKERLGQDPRSSKSNWWITVWRALKTSLMPGLIAGLIVALLTVFVQAKFDDDRSASDNRRENLRFVRDRSSGSAIDRPFTAMDLQGQNLSGLKLGKAQFDNANLSHSNLSFTMLHKGNLAYADLRDSLLLFTRFGEQADLTGANLAHADLTGASLQGARLSGADLSDAVFMRPVFAAQNFKRGSQLGSEFNPKVFLSGGVFSTNLTQGNLRNSKLMHADLSNANLAKADFYKADLTGANLTDAIFTGANFNGADLRKASGLTSLDNSICYDEETKWPRGFEPKYPSGWHMLGRMDGWCLPTGTPQTS